MRRRKRVFIFIWTALPFFTLAGFKQMEADAIDRAYASKECQYQAYEYREKDYQKRYNEGYEKGFDNGTAASFVKAKAATFDVLMDALDEMGVFDKRKEVEKEDVKTALHRTIYQSPNKK